MRAPGVPTGGRILDQRLEVRRVPAWEVVLRGGPSVWVFGDPPELSPADALPSTPLRAAKVGGVGLGVLAAAGLAWWLVQVLLR